MSVKKAIQGLEEMAVSPLMPAELAEKAISIIGELRGLSKLELLLADICARRGVSIEAVKSKSRKREVVLTRYIFFAEAKAEGYTLNASGYLFGMHYSSVKYGLKSVTGQDSDFTQAYQEFKGASTDICVKCGKPFTPRLLKPLTICEDCDNQLTEEFN